MTKQEELFSENELLKLKVHSYAHLVGDLESKNTELSKEVEKYKELYLELKRDKFGKKSEKYVNEDQIGFVFNEAELEASKQDSQEDTQISMEEEVIAVSSYTKKKRGHRKTLPEGLPREIIQVELPESEQVDDEGNKLKIIGYEKSEKLDYEPAKLKVIEYHRAKYGYESGDYVKIAPLKTLFPKAMATESLVSAIIVNKYADGLPLYRQEEILNRLDIDLSRSTLARWVIKAAAELQPIYNVLNERLLQSSYVSVDETRFQVLKEEDRRPEQKSWMWVRSTPSERNKIILFEYDPSRAGEVAKRLLDEFRGHLQCDGYAGYNGLEENIEIIRLGCAMHARRYFEQAFAIGSKSGKTLAEEGLKLFQSLYTIEEEIRDKTAEERKIIREEKQKPIWNQLKEMVDKNKSKVPPESKLGKAFQYFENEYKYLIKYLEDGKLEIDNGFVERAIRKFSIGRNNWLFADTEAGAQSSALLYSLIVTMKINKVNPQKTLKYILERLALVDKTWETDKILNEYEYLADLILAVKQLPEK